MSLSRKEWEEMWSSISIIEKELLFIKPNKAKIERHIKYIKEQIQSVIGQME